MIIIILKLILIMYQCKYMTIMLILIILMIIDNNTNNIIITIIVIVITIINSSSIIIVYLYCYYYYYYYRPGGGGPDPGPAREAPGLTWVEKLTIALLGGLALLSWASLASLLDMGSCRPGLLHGSAAFGGGAIHACDVATVTCDPGFALALDGAAAVQATCAKDQQFFAQGGGALAECGLCAPGHVGYPACARCDSSVHCHGHAASVTDDGRRAACLCSCAGQWGGKDLLSLISQNAYR